LKGIMAAKKKQIAIQTVEALGLSAQDLQPRVSIEQMTLPPSRPPGRILKGDVSEVVPQLLKLLHEEAKIL